MEPSQIEELVRTVLRQELAKAGEAKIPAPSGTAHPEACQGECCVPRVVKPPVPRDGHELERIVGATPARIVQGRTGTRYLTRVYVGLRAEHAIALDAVHSEVPKDLPAKLGALALETRAKDKEDFLLFPDHGRRLSDASRALVEKEATKGVDVQIIAGDGLAAWAITQQGAELVPALARELKSVGLTTGRPLFVRFARIGVQDEIGVLTHAKSTIILVGERPGLGTGDSLSIYTAFGPRLNQDNAEKNCISNIRPLGIPTQAAAAECARLMRRTFDAGGGGIHLVRPVRDLRR
ncbi:MAG: ethanolamine ammonia-lyase subunit EutC [Myxococcaceae bacterium]|nr:ethanolamine ammonia-lyase subunit EutC [Myxococcaceae bacterium]